MKKVLIFFGLIVLIIQSCGPITKKTDEQKDHDSLNAEQGDSAGFTRLIAIINHADAEQRNMDSINSIMIKFSSVCNGQSIIGTKCIPPKNDIHKILFIDEDDWNMKLPDILLPKKISELEFIGCIKRSEKGIGFCDYGDINNIAVYRKKKLVQKQAKISIYNASDCKLVTSKVFFGEKPECFVTSIDDSDIEGTEVTYSDIEVWLSTVITKFPLIELKSVNQQAANSALCSVDVLYEGVSNIERGVCFSTYATPTISGNKTAYSNRQRRFTCEILNLEKSRTYYVRAYLKNKAATFYSNELKFHTTKTYDIFIDKRDNHKYRWIKIGNQTIMAENLAYKPKSGNYWVFNDKSSLSKYGYLYDWKTAKKVAPAGWHIPTKEEWEILYNYLGGNQSTVYEAIKESGDSDFNALLCGYLNTDGTFDGIGESTCFWSATVYGENQAWYFGCGAYGSGAYIYNIDRSYGLSVRLFRD